MDIKKSILLIPFYFYLIKGKDVITIANLRQAKSDEEVKKLTVNNVKNAYHELALDYNHLLDLVSRKAAFQLSVWMWASCGASPGLTLRMSAVWFMRGPPLHLLRGKISGQRARTASRHRVRAYS